MPDDERDDFERAERYRAIAVKLRQIAEGIRLDFRRRQQLHSLADGFERAAKRVATKSE